MAWSDAADLVAHIHDSSREQLGGITQVNHAVNEIDGLTQRNAALVEELAAVAQSLELRAGQMAGTVEVFRTQA